MLFRFYDHFYIYMLRFVIIPYSTRVCVCQSFLHSRECLIGRHDNTCTAIIAHSLCHVEEAIFWDVVSSGEAQRTLKGTHWCSRRQKKAILLCLAPGQVCFTWETWAIALNNKSDWLGFEWGTKNWWLEWPSDLTVQANAKLQDLS